MWARRALVAVLAVAIWSPLAGADEAQQIYACAQRNHGMLRIVDGPGMCRDSEDELSWSIQGPPGPPGELPNSGIVRLAELTGDTGLAGGLPGGLVHAVGCDATLRESGLGDAPRPVLGLIGAEAISRPYEYHILAEGPPSRDWLGAPVKVEFAAGDRSALFAGVVTQVADVGLPGEGALAAVRIAPALAPLELNQGYRVVQGTSIPEVVQMVLASSPQSHELRLGGPTHPTEEMVVQYRESDFDFMSRLMEDAGISYFFEEDGRMVIGDFNGGFTDEGGHITFGDGAHGAASPLDQATRLRLGSRLTGASATVIGFDFRTPELSILGSSPPGDGPPELVFFEPSVEEVAAASRRAQLERERELSNGEFLSGESTSTDVRAGHVLTVDAPAATGFGGRYIVTEVRHAFVRGGDGCLGYGNVFTAIPADLTYRPPRRTPRPRVSGAQTAIVVGAAGQEVLADEYGRVKIQFHWDREGVGDESSSGWVRVGHPPGRTGAVPAYIPEVGDEVLVEFEEGDPSRPIILGSLYNADDPPPSAAPD